MLSSYSAGISTCLSAWEATVIYGTHDLLHCHISTLHSPVQGDVVSGIGRRIRPRSAASSGLGRPITTRMRNTPLDYPAEERSSLWSTGMGLMAAEKSIKSYQIN